MASNTVLRNNIVGPYPARTPLVGKGQGHDAQTGVSWPHVKFFQSVADGVNAAPQFVAQAPASSTSSGEAGSIFADANFVYFCVAANTWRRVAVSAF